MSKTWFDRNTLFPEFLDGCFTREQMTEEREREWVDFCFEAYESDGFKDTFGTEYTGESSLIGKKFKVISRVSVLSDDPEGAELECLPMWNIEFEDGFTMAAYPEEICLSETQEYKKKNAKYFTSK